MRHSFLVALVAVMLTAPTWAAPTGKVLAKDPQLLDSYQITLCGNNVTERDTVRVERDGKTVAEAIVVSVSADRSVVMVKGAKAPSLQAGDEVVVIQRAPAMPTTAAATKPGTELGYKVVGGHSFLFGVTGFNPDSVANPGFSASSTFSANYGSFSPTSFTGDVYSSSGFSANSGFSASSDFGVSPTSFNPTPFSTDIHFGQ